ncbi:hypothetical protein GF366_05110 [Candidatus Peregrinibacteria bacterium]|nr:hypothetical protein [Candidatus Peregrinibacteria bacterium]
MNFEKHIKKSAESKKFSDAEFAVDNLDSARKSYLYAKEKYLNFRIEMENKRDAEMAVLRDAYPEMSRENLTKSFKNIRDRYEKMIFDSKEYRDYVFNQNYYWSKKEEAERKIREQKALVRAEAEAKKEDAQKVEQLENKLRKLEVEELKVEEPKTGIMEGPYGELVQVGKGDQFFLNKKRNNIKSSPSQIHDYLMVKGAKVDRLLISEENGNPMLAVWDPELEKYFYYEPGKKPKKVGEVEFRDGTMYTLTLLEPRDALAKLYDY